MYLAVLASLPFVLLLSDQPDLNQTCVSMRRFWQKMTTKLNAMQERN